MPDWARSPRTNASLLHDVWGPVVEEEDPGIGRPVGFAALPHVELDVEQLDEADTLLFGRRTCDPVAARWPQSLSAADYPQVAAPDGQTAQAGTTTS